MANRHLWEGVELTQAPHETFDSPLRGDLKATFGTGLVCAAVQQGKATN